MKRLNTRREYITLYCSKPTQTQDSEAVDATGTAASDSEDSEFPPCRVVANSTPPNSPGSILSRSCRLQAAISKCGKNGDAWVKFLRAGKH